MNRISNEYECIYGSCSKEQLEKILNRNKPILISAQNWDKYENIIKQHRYQCILEGENLQHNNGLYVYYCVIK